MGIYLHGIEMPNGGYRTVEITFDADGYPMALADGGDAFDVIPVPPHGRLIDADALCEGLVSNHPVVIYAKNADTIIPAEGGADG